MILSEDQRYFDLIDQATEPTVVLVGEHHDQWTVLAESELKKAHIPHTFFSWSALTEARVQGEWVRFPVLQLWQDNVLKVEVVGFSQEKYRRLAQAYLRF